MLCVGTNCSIMFFKVPTEEASLGHTGSIDIDTETRNAVGDVDAVGSTRHLDSGLSAEVRSVTATKARTVGGRDLGGLGGSCSSGGNKTNRKIGHRDQDVPGLQCPGQKLPGAPQDRTQALRTGEVLIH